MDRTLMIADVYETGRLSPVNESGAVALLESPDLMQLRQQLAEQVLEFGTFEYNTDRKTVAWSDGLYGLMGYGNARPEIDSETFFLTVSGAIARSRNADAGDMPECYSAEYYSSECDVLTADGKTKTICVSGRIVPGQGDSGSHHVGLIRNITRDRDAALRARQQISRLEQSNTDLEGFAYIASHDLQEPLRKISNYADRVLHGKTLFDAEDIRYLERIVASSIGMRGLIDSLLDYSRLSYASDPFREADTGILLRQVLTDAELQIEESGALITIEGLPVMELMPARIKQVFFNLVINALKFCRHGVRPEICVSAEALQQSEKETAALNPALSYYRFTVRDNGIGFEDEYAQRIFHIFQRLHGKSEYPGSGIGLAICKKIIEQHNGCISATGNPEYGASFSFILPRYQQLPA